MSVPLPKKDEELRQLMKRREMTTKTKREAKELRKQHRRDLKKIRAAYRKHVQDA